MLAYVCFWIPFSFAEWRCVGRGNSPWTANLALCARMAHQSDSLATPRHSGIPSAYLGTNVRDGILLVTFLLLLKEK